MAVFGTTTIETGPEDATRSVVVDVTGDGASESQSKLNAAFKAIEDAFEGNNRHAFSISGVVPFTTGEKQLILIRYDISRKDQDV